MRPGYIPRSTRGCELLLEVHAPRRTRCKRCRRNFERLNYTADVQIVLHIRARIPAPVNYMNIKSGSRTRRAGNLKIECGINRRSIQIIIKACGCVCGLGAVMQAGAVLVEKLDHTVERVGAQAALRKCLYMNDGAAAGDKFIEVRIGIWIGGIYDINVRTDVQQDRNLKILTVSKRSGCGDGIVAAQGHTNNDEVAGRSCLWRIARVSSLYLKIVRAVL